MNAIAENEFVDGFRRVGETLPKPHAIICISAHWQTVAGSLSMTSVKIAGAK
jgi:aromatic ring-opening dioxygenase catalytic subunit (LigB family)